MTIEIAKRPMLAALLLIAMAVAAIYANTLHAPFVFDDDTTIVQNALIRPETAISALWSAQPTRFIGNLSFALNHRLGGLRVEGYHAANIAIHLLASLCLFWLVLALWRTPAARDLTLSARRRIALALFAALVFAVHPLQTQAVTYIVQRFASLAALFYLATVAAYLEYRLATGVTRWRWLALSALCGLLALLTKENAFSLPLMLLAAEACCCGNDRLTRAQLAIGIAALAGIALLAAALDLLPRETTAISRPQYLFTQFRVMLTYLRLLVAPVAQTMDYDYPIYSSILALPVLAGCAAVVGLLAAAVGLFRRYPLVSFAILWFFIALSVESSLIPISDVIFEHRLYLPLAGFALLPAAAAAYWGARLRPRFMVTIAGMLVLGLGLCTVMRNEIWRSKYRILNDTVVKAPHKARPVDYRGNFWADIKWYDMALSDYSRAIALDSLYWKASYHRGSLLALSARYREALPDLRRAIRLAPDFAPSYVNAGNTLLGLGRADSAIFCYNEALSLDPANPSAYGNRGLAFVRKGEVERGLRDYGRALALDTSLHYVELDRGLALNSLRQYGEALPVFDRYLAAVPNDPGALAGRAWALFQLRRYREAENDFRQAVFLKAVLPAEYKPMAQYFATHLAE